MSAYVPAEVEGHSIQVINPGKMMRDQAVVAGIPMKTDF
jgi:hypothetical protein